MPVDDATGCNELVPQYRQSTIWLLDPLDYPPLTRQLCLREQDLERTLVHELLHCYLTTEGQGEQGTEKTEVIVDALAKAFVTLDRRASASGTDRKGNTP